MAARGMARKGRLRMRCHHERPGAGPHRPEVPGVSMMISRRALSHTIPAHLRSPTEQHRQAATRLPAGRISRHAFHFEQVTPEQEWPKAVVQLLDVGQRPHGRIVSPQHIRVHAGYQPVQFGAQRKFLMCFRAHRLQMCFRAHRLQIIPGT